MARRRLTAGIWTSNVDGVRLSQMERIRLNSETDRRFSPVTYHATWAEL